MTNLTNIDAALTRHATTVIANAYREALYFYADSEHEDTGDMHTIDIYDNEPAECDYCGEVAETITGGLAYCGIHNQEILSGNREALAAF